MTPLRTKDRLFLAVAVPAALIAAYAYFWRAPHAKKVRAYGERCAALVDPEDFPAEKRKLEKRVAESAAELEAERGAPAPESAMKGSPDDAPAARERIVLDVFREAGLRVVSSEAGERTREGGASAPRGGEVLKATALRPEPRARRYRLEGGYAAVRRALCALAERKCAVIPETLEMEGGDRWTVLLWL